MILSVRKEKSRYGFYTSDSRARSRAALMRATEDVSRLAGQPVLMLRIQGPPGGGSEHIPVKARSEWCLALPRNYLRVPPIKQPSYLVARDRARREFKILDYVVIELAVVESTVLVIPMVGIRKGDTILEDGISRGRASDTRDLPEPLRKRSSAG
jgi:hypothetical protein